jgi:hypothetical protein
MFTFSQSFRENHHIFILAKTVNFVKLPRKSTVHQNIFTKMVPLCYKCGLHWLFSKKLQEYFRHFCKYSQANFLRECKKLFSRKDENKSFRFNHISNHSLPTFRVLSVVRVNCARTPGTRNPTHLFIYHHHTQDINPHLLLLSQYEKRYFNYTCLPKYGHTSFLKVYCETRLSLTCRL